MSFNYDISVLELLDILDCQPNPDYQPDPRLPALLNEFLSRAYNHPLFRTADIWTAHPCWFSYEAIEERIEEDRNYYQEHPEELAGDSYAPFFQSPKAEWSKLVPNYLEIGSDHAVGVVEFGIREADLGQADPMVYMLHEIDEPTGWKPFTATLTGYLKYVLCAILCGADYHTGQTVLEKAGWSYTECEKPEEAPMIPCVFDLAVCCGYDADTNSVLSIMIDTQWCKVFQITKKD